MSEPTKRILRKPKVEEVTGLSRTTIFDLEKQGKFPARIRLTEHASGWLESDVMAWIDQRIAASRGESSAA